MSDNDHNIDKLFREKLFQRNFEFDQGLWEKAQKQIREEENKRKPGISGKKYLAIISAALIFLAGSGILLIKLMDEIPENTIVENSPEKETKTPVNETRLNEENIQLKDKTENKASGGKKSESLQSRNLNPKESASAKNPGKNSMAPGGKSGNSSSGKIITGESSSQDISSAQLQKPRKDRNVKSESDLQNIREQEPEIITASGKPQTENPDLSESKTGGVGNEPLPPMEKTSATDEYLNNSGNNSINATPEIQSVNTNGLTPSGVKPVVQEVDEFDSEILLPTVITMNKEGEIPEEKELTESETEKASPLKDRLNWLRHISISFSGGINISGGFLNTENKRAGISAKPLGGFRLAYQINNQVDFESGLVYDYRSGLNSSIKSLVSNDIPNNVARYSTSATQSVHYLDIPVHFTYKYGKHSLILGMHYAQMINSREQLLVTREENGISVVEQSTMRWAGNDGRFSTYDIAGIFGFDYAVSDRFKLCMRINQGLFDITDDASFGNSVRDNHRQLRILLDYKLVKY